MVFDYHNLKFFFGIFRSWYNSVTTTDHWRHHGSCHYHFWRWFYELEMVMSTTNPSRFKPFLRFMVVRRLSGKRVALPFWWLFMRSIEIFLREYTKTITMRVFASNHKNGVMVIKKNGITIPFCHEKTIGGLPTTTDYFTPKKWFMVLFFWFFRKFRIFLLINSSEG